MMDTLRKSLRTIVYLGGWMMTAACGTDSTAPTLPTAAPAAENASVVSTVGGTVNAVSGLLQVNVLNRKVALNAPVTARRVIGPAGGVIEIPSVGVRFEVPPGALDSTVNITVVAIAGKLVAYEFAPHGLTFKRPAQFQQDLRHTTALLQIPLGGGYFRSAGQINPNEGTALINELISAYIRGGWFFFPVKHFSGYLVSCA